MRRGLGNSSRPVVSVKALSSSAKAEDLGDDKLLSGDIVEQVHVRNDGLQLTAPFAGGKAGLQQELRRLHGAGHTLLHVKVRRGRSRTLTIKAVIIPYDLGKLKKQYALKAFSDSSHVVIFTDSTEEECQGLQDMRSARLVSQLASIQLTDVSLPYAWDDKIRQVQPAGGSSMVFSMLVVPYAPESGGAHYNDLEDTVARAMAWFSASQATGVPINFLNIQTEPLLTKVSGQQASSRTVSASSRGDLGNIANTGIYGFEDYHGIDIGVVRAVRIWFVPNYAEVAVMLKVEEDETRLGVGISRTEEGFCHVSTVEAGTCADRAGVRNLLVAAQAVGKLLVLSRVAEEKVTPWLISSAGAIRCYDTSSVSRKLLALRDAGQPARLHFMAWEGVIVPAMDPSVPSFQGFEQMSSLSSDEFERGQSAFFR